MPSDVPGIYSAGHICLMKYEPSHLSHIFGPTVLGTSHPPLHLGYPHLPRPRSALTRTGLPSGLYHHPVPGHPTPEQADHHRGDLQAGEHGDHPFIEKICESPSGHKIFLRESNSCKNFLRAFVFGCTSSLLYCSISLVPRPTCVFHYSAAVGLVHFL